MTEAVIVSTARTPIGKAFRGAFNKTHGAVLASHAIRHAVDRAGVEVDEVEDVILGCGLPEGATGWNVARMAAIRAGLPVATSAITINRFCSSGMQAIAFAGGLNVVADPQYVRVYRQKSDGKIVDATFQISGTGISDAVSVKIKPGDVVAVEHTDRTRTRVLIAEIIQFNTGVIYPIR